MHTSVRIAISIMNMHSKCYSKTIHKYYRSQVFSLCHISIRSQKASLKSFEICLENLQFNFTVIGITKWLNVYNCDL